MKLLNVSEFKVCGKIARIKKKLKLQKKPIFDHKLPLQNV